MKKIAVIGVPGGWSSEALTQCVRERLGQSWLVDLETVVLDLEHGRLFNHDVELGEMDAIIIKKAGPFYSPHLLDRLEMLRLLHARGVPVFSDPLRILRTLDRVSCTVTLRAGNIPMPPTAITENVEMARDFVAHYKRAIFKPLYSTKARGMVVIEDSPRALEQIQAFKDLGNEVMYLQQMVSHPGRDMGVAFLGGQYLGTFARKGDSESWNTTTRNGGKYTAFEPGEEIRAMARKAQNLFGLDFTSVDVVETPDGPMVFEVSAFGGFSGLRDAHGIDAAALYVDYVLKKDRFMNGIASLSDSLFRAHLPPERVCRLSLDFSGYITEVVSNSPQLLEKLRTYFRDFLPAEEGAASAPDVTITALEAPPQDPAGYGLALQAKPREPGKKIKEEFVNLSDGRVVLKRLTGMLFLFGQDRHLAIGPCVANDNQVVNFINNRFIQWTLDQGGLLFHAAGVALPGAGGLRGLALAGFAGMGKSTLALRIMRHGATFVSNDRLIVKRGGAGLTMYGVAKMPRINPGTVLHNPHLTPVIPQEERRRYEAMPLDELWSLEHKYDAFIDECFGAGRFKLSAAMRALVLLNWKRPHKADQETLVVREVDLGSRPDLLPAFMKSVGLFYGPTHRDMERDFGREAYLELLRGVPVYELTGTADFEAAALACVDLALE